MSYEISKNKTDQALLDKLREAKKPTRQEITAQKISFAFANLDDKTTMTRERVKRLVEENAEC